MHQPIKAGLPNGHSGISLIEVLVALTIFALALLGIAQTQWRALQETQLAEWRSHSALEAMNLLECLRASRTAALAGAYDLAIDAATPMGNAMADQERNRWRDRLAEQMGSRGAIVMGAEGRVKITVGSDESRLGGSPSALWVLDSQL